MTTEPHLETIVPITYTTRELPTGELELSRPSLLSIAAAVIRHAAAPDGSRLLIAGEHTFGADKPSTGDVMKDFAVTAGVAADQITLLAADYNLINTLCK